jgi:serine protease Do
LALGGAGRKLALEIQRGNQQRQLTVTVAEMPAEAGGAPSRVTPHAPSAAEGVAVQPLNPALRQRLGLPNDVRHGVVVSEIEPGSAAARAGLRAGDVVLEIDRQKVQRVEQFHELFAKSQGPTLLLVHRRGATSFLVIKR